MSSPSYTKRLLCVKFRESRSIPFEIIAIFGNPTRRSTAILEFQIYDLQRQQNKKTVYLLKFVKFRENRSSRFQVTAFDGNPIWRSAAILDSPLCKYRGKLQYWGCILLVCVNFCENRSIRSRVTPFFEIQYGGRSPSWILEMYAFYHLALNRMPFYANIENFMPIGLPVQKLERFYYCGVLAKNSVCRVVFLGVFRVP
jgi:hypothetical protein